MNVDRFADLQVFATVARLRSFRRAAAELGVSPSALSHTLRSLEASLGIRLLNRTTRSVAPTDAGEALLSRLAPALQGMQDALESINVFRDSPLGTLRINAPRAACELVLAPIVARFVLLHPGMRVELVADDSIADIVAGGFDAGVRFGERLQQDMIAVPIGRAQRFVVVGAPSYLDGASRPRHPRDLQRHRCIGLRFPSQAIYRWEFARRRERLEVEVDGPITLNDMRSIVRAAEAGAGLAYVYEDYARAAIRDGTLVTLLDTWCPPGSAFQLYYPSRRLLSAGLDAFIRLVREGPDVERSTLCSS